MAPSSTRRKTARSKPTAASPTAVLSDSTNITAAISSPTPAQRPQKSSSKLSARANGGINSSSGPTASSADRKRKRGDGAEDRNAREPDSPLSQRPKNSPADTPTPVPQSPPPAAAAVVDDPLNPLPDPDLSPNTPLHNSTYTVHSVLGRGHFSTTYLATHHPTASKVAIKRFHSTWRSVGECELALHSRVPEDPHIVKYIGNFTDDTGRIHIVLEPLCASRPLQLPQCVHGGQHRAIECETRHRALAVIISQILTALLALHKIGIVHADVTPGNVLYTSDQPGSTDVKLIDFSNSLDLGDAAEGVGETSILDQQDPDSYELQTPCYRAPEILLGSAQRLKGKIDIWSVGVMAVELLLDGEVVGDGVEGAELLRPPVEGREGLVRRLVEVFGSVESCRGGVHWRELFHDISWRWGMKRGEGKKAVAEKRGAWRDVISIPDNLGGVMDFLQGLVKVDEKERWDVKQALRNRWLVKQVWGGWGDVVMGMMMGNEQQEEDGERQDRRPDLRLPLGMQAANNTGNSAENAHPNPNRSVSRSGGGGGGGSVGLDTELDDDDERVMLV